MIFWILAGAMAALVVAALLWPLLRARDAVQPAGEFDRAVYRDQLAELDADLQRGLIDRREAEAARREIERRLLQTETTQGPNRGVSASAWMRPVALALVVCLPPLAGLALYLHLGSPGLPGLPLADRDPGGPEEVGLLVTQLEASALVPALKFHFADQIPVYATSQTVRGASPERLRDLAGFRVSELPWFALETPSYRALDDAFALAGSPFAALYALGVDAFRLAERLPLVLDGSMTELLGSTGELSFTPSGRVQRRLARAEVRAGRVQVPGTVGR